MLPYRTRPKMRVTQSTTGALQERPWEAEWDEGRNKHKAKAVHIVRKKDNKDSRERRH